MEKPRKGIVLITTLLLLCFLAILGTSLVLTGSDNMTLTPTFQEREAAIHAAQTGIDWAIYRLENDRYWNAGTPMTYTNGKFHVEEGSGVCRCDINDTQHFYITFETSEKYHCLNNLDPQRGKGAANNYDNEGNFFRTVPPFSADIIARGYSTGGGAANNVRSLRYLEKLYKFRGTGVVFFRGQTLTVRSDFQPN
ncbi:MAG: hypothetical protein V2A78_00830 [bacterium]